MMRLAILSIFLQVDQVWRTGKRRAAATGRVPMLPAANCPCSGACSYMSSGGGPAKGGNLCGGVGARAGAQVRNVALASLLEPIVEPVLRAKPHIDWRALRTGRQPVACGTR